MKFPALIILIAVTLSGCNKEKLSERLEGVYKGSFVRTADPLTNPVTSSVTLHLSGEEFSGSSNIQNYPAICEGTYLAFQATINLKSRCYFTANFDWTLIFDGKYNYEKKGSSLRIWRDYSNGTRDLYVLEKVVK